MKVGLEHNQTFANASTAAAGGHTRSLAGSAAALSPLNATLPGIVPLLVIYDKEGQGQSERQNGEIPAYKHRNKEQKQKARLYSSLHSGFIWNREIPLRFLTLTSADDSPSDIWPSFKRLVKGIRRMTPARLVDTGYLTPDEMARYYGESDPTDPLEIEYAAAETTEGNGVIHAMTRGAYIPQRLIGEAWYAIHGAWNVDIRLPRGKNGSLKYGRYMLAQYIGGQSAIVRTSTSKHWIYPGWREDLLDCVKANKKEYGETAGYYRALQVWDTCMLRHIPYRSLYGDNRTTLADFGVPDATPALEATTKAAYESWAAANGITRLTHR